MSKPLLPDELWERIEPLLPPFPPHPQGGRPWTGNREALTGILFVLRSGIPWELLPTGDTVELGSLPLVCHWLASAKRVPDFHGEGSRR